MVYEIEYTVQAQNDLAWLKKHEQVVVVSTIEEQLSHQPVVETHNRKRLRENDVAEWELRVGVFRVLYNVDEVVRIVEIQRIAKKSGSVYLFRGREEEL